MENIEVKIVEDSVNPANKRITTFLWTYPRFIHSEVMTYRMLSRNAASSQAIPIEKQIAAVDRYPAHPEQWGSNKAGMQAGEEVDNINDVREQWTDCAACGCAMAEDLQSLGLHKQIVNRVLEPFSRITTLVTATDWDNFFSLRAHPAAQPEFQVLAYRTLALYLNNEPNRLLWGQWHTPFAPASLPLGERQIQSVASAARTSYTKQDDDFPFEKQKALFMRLYESGHWSPFEHQAKAAKGIMRSGNFTGQWMQYRQIFRKQNRTGVDLRALLATKPDWIEL